MLKLFVTKVKKVQMRRKTGRKYTQRLAKEKQLVFVALVRETIFPIRKIFAHSGLVPERMAEGKGN